MRRPVIEFRSLFDELGLAWTGDTEEYLLAHDSPGRASPISGWPSGLSGAWQTKLDDQQLATLRRVLGWFPITTWGDHDFDSALSQGSAVTRPPHAKAAGSEVGHSAGR